MELEQNLEKKEINTLRFIWKPLNNKRRYIQPQSIKELKEKGVERNPHLTIAGRSLFLDNELLKLLHQSVEIISNSKILKNLFTYHSVYKAFFSVLEKSVGDKITGDFSPVILREISKELNGLLDKREYTFALRGVKFVSIKELCMGEVELAEFDEVLLQKALDYEKQSTDDPEVIGMLEDFLRKAFLGKIVVTASGYGDSDRSRNEARTKARLAVNYLRFLSCILLHDRVHENLLKISFEDETYLGGEQLFFKSSKKDLITMSSGVGRRNLQDFPLSEERIQEICSNIFYNDFCAFAFSNQKTQVESTIIVATHWIGEAQHDYDPESSFLKFWTSLESIFTTSHSDITKNLAEGVSALLVFSGYRFAPLSDLQTIYKDVSSLYALRSKIVHRGNLDQLTHQNINKMAMYAAYTILALLDLRSRGYTSMAEIQSHTERLHKQANAEANRQSNGESN